MMTGDNERAPAWLMNFSVRRSLVSLCGTLACLLMAACTGTGSVAPAEEELLNGGDDARPLELPDAVVETQRTLHRLLGEDDPAGGIATVLLSVDAAPLYDVLETLLRGVDVEVRFHDDVDIDRAVSADLPKDKWLAVAEVCRLANVEWRVGPGYIYFGSAEAVKDAPLIEHIYQLPREPQPHPVSGLASRLTAASVQARSSEERWLGMLSDFDIERMSDSRIKVRGRAIDHVRLLETIQGITCVPD